MKTNIVGVIIALILAAIFSVNVMAKDKVEVSETRKVGNFYSVEITSVATVYFTQSNTCSLKIEGKEERVKETVTYVKDGKLIVDFKDKNNSGTKNRKDGVIIYLTAPDLKEVDFEGVGSFNCDTPLKLGDVKFKVEGVGKINVKDLICRNLSVSMEGVGKAEIHVNCEYLRANIDGVGSVKLSGAAGKADVSKSGIGRVSTSDLKIGK